MPTFPKVNEFARIVPVPVMTLFSVELLAPVENFKSPRMSSTPSTVSTPMPQLFASEVALTVTFSSTVRSRAKSAELTVLTAPTEYSATSSPSARENVAFPLLPKTKAVISTRPCEATIRLPFATPAPLIATVSSASVAIFSVPAETVAMPITASPRISVEPTTSP